VLNTAAISPEQFPFQGIVLAVIWHKSIFDHVI